MTVEKEEQRRLERITDVIIMQMRELSGSAHLTVDDVVADELIAYKFAMAIVADKGCCCK